MILIEKIEIAEFRGIRNLSLDLAKQSFGIAGPNGTGKSGIVDAIEFVLTGDITRLGGVGTGEISVKQHAPHVDSSKNPEKAIVRITAFAKGLGKSFVIERSVKAASTPTLTPDDPSTRALVAKLETHPEFALSRREIIKYILTPAGNRSKDVQILLRLDEIEKVRSSLQRIANDTKKESARAHTDDQRAKNDIVQHLGIQSATKSELLAAVNLRRELLKLPPLSDLAADTSIKEGVAGRDGNDASKSRLLKSSTLADLAGYEGYASALTSEGFKKAVDQSANLLDQLVADPTLLTGYRQKVLIEQGLALIDDDSCPLCDVKWDLENLRTHLEQKARAGSAAATFLAEFARRSAPVTSALENVAIAAQTIAQACGRAEPNIDAAALSTLAATCDKDRVIFQKLEGDPSLVEDAIAALNRIHRDLIAEPTEVAHKLKAHVESLPEPSNEDAAKEYLIVAQEKYDRCKIAKAEMETAASRETTAATVFDHYGTVSTNVLEGIYDKVQKDFTTYYRYINRDDEELFEGALTPSVGKLAFDVDFYGRGKFPPGAYHSEGHQDGMEQTSRR